MVSPAFSPLKRVKQCFLFLSGSRCQTHESALINRWVPVDRMKCFNFGEFQVKPAVQHKRHNFDFQNTWNSPVFLFIHIRINRDTPNIEIPILLTEKTINLSLYKIRDSSLNKLARRSTTVRGVVTFSLISVCRWWGLSAIRYWYGWVFLTLPYKKVFQEKQKCRRQILGPF